jgi:hypothetical protein
VRIRDCEGLSTSVEPGAEFAPKNSAYFKHASDMSFAITIRGQFLQSFSADDLVFGNVFDAPLRLPPGAGLGVRMLRMLMDPGLEADLYGPNPWAWSPVLCTMRTMAVCLVDKESTAEEQEKANMVDATLPLEECNQYLFTDSVARKASARRSHFAKAVHRQAVQLSPQYRYAMEFCNGLIDFNTLGVRLPGWGSISLLSFWDGQVSLMGLLDN